MENTHGVIECSEVKLACCRCARQVFATHPNARGFVLVLTVGARLVQQGEAGDSYLVYCADHAPVLPQKDSGPVGKAQWKVGDLETPSYTLARAVVKAASCDAASGEAVAVLLVKRPGDADWREKERWLAGRQIFSFDI